MMSTVLAGGADEFFHFHRPQSWGLHPGPSTRTETVGHAEPEGEMQGSPSLKQQTTYSGRHKCFHLEFWWPQGFPERFCQGSHLLASARGGNPFKLWVVKCICLGIPVLSLLVKSHVHLIAILWGIALPSPGFLKLSPPLECRVCLMGMASPLCLRPGWQPQASGWQVHLFRDSVPPPPRGHPVNSMGNPIGPRDF